MTNIDYLESKVYQDLVTSAAQAAEIFDEDELERFAESADRVVFERLKAAYLEERRERHTFNKLSVQMPYQTATYCLRNARYRLKYKDLFDWDYGDGEVLRTATIKRGPVTYIATIVADYDTSPNDNDDGKFTSGTRYSSNPEDSKDDRPDRESVWVSLPFSNISNGADGWYDSGYGYKERRSDYERLGRQGSHEAARLMLRRDAARYEDFWAEKWQYVGVKVEAFVNGIEVGDAALWGCDFDGKDYTYINQTAQELIEEVSHGVIDVLEAQAKHSLDSFTKAIIAADKCFIEESTARNLWIEKMMDYSNEVGESLPKPKEVK